MSWGGGHHHVSNSGSTMKPPPLLSMFYYGCLPWSSEFWLLIIKSARGLSIQQLLWHPSYVLLGVNSLQRFGLRPHEIVEVLAGEVPCGTSLTMSRAAVTLCCHRNVHVCAVRNFSYLRWFTHPTFQCDSASPNNRMLLWRPLCTTWCSYLTRQNQRSPRF